jgi:energy-coupling factor transporter ATP-binding protein EcfA2
MGFEDFMNLPEESNKEFVKVNEFFDLKDDNAINLCIITGPSGSGKSTFEKCLTTAFANHELFFKLPQVTTRDIRENETGDEYYFISKETYNNLDGILIGRVTADKDSFMNYYGTLPLYRKGKINTLILAPEGINDTLVLLEQYKNLKVLIINLDIEWNEVDPSGFREGRNEEFFQREREGIEYVIRSCKRRYPNLVKIITHKHSDWGRFPLATDIFDFTE